MMQEKINYWTIAQDIASIFTAVFIPLFVLLQIIKGINYFETLSMEWWMIIGLIIVMLKSNVLSLGEWGRSKKYSSKIKKIFINYKKNKEVDYHGIV